MDLPPIPLTRRTGEESFSFNHASLSVMLLDYWRWSCSDLVSNANRGILAEFIVAMAIGQHDSVRAAWDAFDLRTDSGVRVEVKSAAYIQSWHQRDYSKITFSIRKTLAWSAETNAFDEESKRQADVYVFALLDHKEQSTLDPLNLNQWAFNVISAHVLDTQLPTAKSVSLTKLNSLHPKQCTYEGLNQAIQAAFDSSTSS